MRLFRDRRDGRDRYDRRAEPVPTPRQAARTDLKHLTRFAAGHGGVEAFLEPRTTVTPTTVVLVAASGEWTRRRVEDVETARRVCRRLAVPLYDVAVTNYPPRMREWTARRRPPGESGAPGLGGPGG